MRENMTLGINVLLSIIYFKIDAVILSAMKPSLDVGIYGAAYKVLEILLAFPAIFMGTVFPSLSRVITQDLAKTKIILQQAFDLLAMAGWGVVVGLIVLAGPIISFTTKGEVGFLTTATISIGNLPITAPVILQILSLAVGLSFLGNLFLSAIVAQGSQKKLIAVNAINAVINIGLNVIFIRYFTYVAAAGLTILSEIIMLTFLAITLKRAIHFLPKATVLWRSGICALGMGIALLLIREQTHVIISTILGGLLYTSLLILSGCLNREMVELVIKRPAIGNQPTEGSI